MSYLKTIEFLVKEVAKANEQIESLTRKAEDDKSVMDRLGDFHDKHFEDAMSAKEELKQMTFERDDWQKDALRCREIEKQYWEEIDDLKSKVVDANQYRIKVVSELEDKLSLTEKRYQDLIKQNKEVEAINRDIIKDLQLEINHLKNNK